MIPNVIVDSFAWLALFFYFACFIPQIIENYRIKSTKGLSSISLMAYFIGYTSLMYYIFLLDLMLPYKVVVPLEFGCMVIIALQRFYYEGIFTDKIYFSVMLGTLVAAIVCFPLALWYPLQFGSVCGWVSLTMFVLHPIPQAIKIFREKSVEGFSFGFVTLLAIAVAFELLVALLRNLPVQTIFMAVKGLVFYVIFCIQFWLYGKNAKNTKTILEEVFMPCLHAQEGKDENSINFPVCLTCTPEQAEQK